MKKLNKKQIVSVGIGLSLMIPLVFNSANKHRSLKDNFISYNSLKEDFKISKDVLARALSNDNKKQWVVNDLMDDFNEERLKVDKASKRFEKSRMSFIFSVSLIFMVMLAVICFLYLFN